MNGGIVIAVLFAPLFLSFLGPSDIAQAQSAGSIISYSTIYSIGIEWSLTGDTNHNAKATVQYRKTGASAYKQALDLVRVDFGGKNMLAGSILFLEPGTQYEVKLDYSDPDGGSDSRTIFVTTRVLPSAPVGGNTYHVTPGSGGGSGSLSDPFRGISAAQAVAIPGATFLLHVGNYGSVTFNKAGSEGSYIVWKAAGDGEATFGAITVSASNLWFEGLTIRDQATGMVASGSPVNNVVSRNSFQNNHKAISLNSTAAYWYIADNNIVGDNDPLGGSLSGEGVDLRIGDGHTVAHNSISRVADGISYPSDNVDIFGNDIFDTSDDGIETDNGGVNVRVWQNRLHFPFHNGFTFQDQVGAPWYYIRNQAIVDTGEGIFKFVAVDRFLAFHNTFINTQPLKFNRYAEHQLKAYSRNNLYIATGSGGSRIWDHRTGIVDWRTNLDYDGFDWGPFANPFLYSGTQYATIPAYTAATGQETNGIKISAATCFEAGAYNKRAAEAHLPPPQLTLKSTCAAIDAGQVLANINDDYLGSAPDLGAHEFGGIPLVYGPRQTGGPPPSPPSIPSSLAATSVSTSQINLSWADVSNETSYKIERCQGAGCAGFTQIATVGTNVTSYQDTGLIAATPYSYRVRASNSGGDSGYSNTASATTQAAPSPPAAPSSLAAAAISASQINLSWADVSAETSYKIERCQGSSCTNFAEIATVGANITSYQNTGLTAATSYSYRIRASNSGGDSGYSNTASATTQSLPLPPSPPSAPTSLSLSALSSSQINLSWADASTNEDGFKIERCQGVGCTGFTQIATAGANAVSYQNTGLSAATSYSYRVRAYNAGGDSSYSNTASVTTQSAAATSTFSYFYIETESPTTLDTTDMETISDTNASGGQAIRPKACSATPTPAGCPTNDITNPQDEATYAINISQAGNYHLWVRVAANAPAANNNDALYARFDTNAWDRIFPSSAALNAGTYEWVRAEFGLNSGVVLHNLSAGSHTAKLSYGERLSRADRILVTNDLNFVPTGVGQAPLAPPTLDTTPPSAPQNLFVVGVTALWEGISRFLANLALALQVLLERLVGGFFGR